MLRGSVRSGVINSMLLNISDESSAQTAKLESIAAFAQGVGEAASSGSLIFRKLGLATRYD